MPKGTTTAGLFIIVSWHVPPAVNDDMEQANKEGTNHIIHLLLFHSLCPPFFFLSDSIDTTINLLPHSITSLYCMPLPSIHPLNLTLIPSSSPFTSLSINSVPSLPLLLCAQGGCQTLILRLCILWGKMTTVMLIQVNWWPKTKKYAKYLDNFAG